MKVAIQQPHVWPWLGYLNKLAKVDKFVFMDSVQMEKGSYMYRNRVLNHRGEIVYLTISGNKHGFLDKEYREIHTKEEKVWKEKQLTVLYNAYGSSPYYKEVAERIFPFYEFEADTICAYALESTRILSEVFEINTQWILLSSLKCSDEARKNDLVLEICRQVGATDYLSGNGARKYMSLPSFKQSGIHVAFQQFSHPVYKQFSTSEFVPGLSALDMLFCCGIEKSKKMFWQEVYAKNEFSAIETLSE